MIRVQIGDEPELLLKPRKHYVLTDCFCFLRLTAEGDCLTIDTLRKVGDAHPEIHREMLTYAINDGAGIYQPTREVWNCHNFNVTMAYTPNLTALESLSN